MLGLVFVRNLPDFEITVARNLLLSNDAHHPLLETHVLLCDIEYMDEVDHVRYNFCKADFHSSNDCLMCTDCSFISTKKNLNDILKFY